MLWLRLSCFLYIFLVVLGCSKSPEALMEEIKEKELSLKEADDNLKKLERHRRSADTADARKDVNERIRNLKEKKFEIHAEIREIKKKHVEAIKKAKN